MPKGWLPPLEEDKTGNLEHKRWIMNETQHQLEVISSGIQSDKQNFLNKFNEFPEDLRDTRNIFIPLVSGAIATVIGLREIDPIAQYLLPLVLILVNVLSLGVFIIEFLRTKIERNISEIAHAFDIMDLDANMNKGFVGRAALDIRFFKESDLIALWKLLIVAHSDRTVLISTIDKVSSYPSMRLFRPALKAYADLQKAVMSYGVELFRKYQNEIVKSFLAKQFLGSVYGTTLLRRFME